MNNEQYHVKKPGTAALPTPGSETDLNQSHDSGRLDNFQCYTFDGYTFNLNEALLISVDLYE